jgi:Glycosyltransferase like family 2
VASAHLAPLIVAIPARNEARRVARTLQALGQQQGETASSLRVVVLANNCSDDTASVARTTAESLSLNAEVIERTFPPEQAHVGRARGEVLALAAAALLDHPGGLLATTDADTVVAPDWAQRMRRALARADVVGGRILTLPEERSALPRGLRYLQLQDTAYHLLASQLTSRLDPDPYDPWPRHHQHFGANLGLRLSAWRKLKAWPEVRCLEDVALVQALQRLDLRVRHCPGVRVWTSARACGRVETGLSSQLREWQELQTQGGCWTVPGAEELQAAAAAGNALRTAWEGGHSSPELEHLWLVDTGALNLAITAPTLGLARELALQARHATGHWVRRYPPVSVEVAVRALRAMLD